ncbi:eukaryotic translation initiation factor [Physcomitrium patens]|uniref:eIF-4F 25 kDa subunit n=1 Tax=Physcomitrium patens TaxID=3218 RepID=A0A2K1L6Z8_PHYPA|nr:eukaryotic translation initiation factor 4E-1-like [Physcomitrium patens]PNR61815.1 hypothetical protein PHYPA_000239 [Physcomitrium patens]|eukprot:XP_024373246.1 eukaryotic translation initiation factor 4E-1-like [Physcomitrella patens]
MTENDAVESAVAMSRLTIMSGGVEELEYFEETSVNRQPEAKMHLLQHSWTFWFDNPNGKQKQATWGTSLREVYTFYTVEQFWGLYNNVLPPSKMSANADFHCFKTGIQPKWEDPKCAHGGKWTVQLPRSGGKMLLDTYWLYTLLAMIGEQFDEGDEICGAVVSARRAQDKIAIWTTTASNENAQISIGTQWKDVLDYHEKLGYVFHDDAKRQEKNAKSRYTV